MSDFNSEKPEGMRMLVWITVKNVLDELLSNSLELAGSPRTVLKKHKGNPYSGDQIFCIAIKIGVPFDLTTGTVNPMTQETALNQLNYNNLPICCRFCWSTSHLIKDCTAL
jgi:hypothetical protein